MCVCYVLFYVSLSILCLYLFIFVQALYLLASELLKDKASIILCSLSSFLQYVTQISTQMFITVTGNHLSH